MTKKATGIISYITIIGWIIAYLAGDKEGAKFHLNQSLVINVTGLALSIIGRILAWIPLIRVLAGLVLAVAGLGLFVLWILGLVYAVQEEEKAVPVLGGIQILK